MKKLNLFWWNLKPNVGDFASFYITSHLCKNKIVHKQPDLKFKTLVKRTFLWLFHKGEKPKFNEYLFPWEKVVYGIGSIIDYADRRTVVWGSGFREFESKTKCKDFRLVRGILSRNKIGNPLLKIGDPALLLPLFYRPKNSQNKKSTVIVPHFTEYEYFKRTYGNKFDILKIETNDIEDFIDQIASAKFILSTSLHGIIIAHAYGIPALWIKKGYIQSSEFKFLDYFSSVDIEAYPPIQNIEDLLNNPNSISRLFEDMKKSARIQCSLKKLQKDIIESFPYRV